MVYVTSDLHGRFDCLKILLDKSGFYDSDDNWLYIIGDVIDRNCDGGVDILKWLLIQSNVQLILGNHEDMLLSNAWVFDEVTDESLSGLEAMNIEALRQWEANGGDVTLKALSKESHSTRCDIIEYLRDCPLYESVTVGERNYLLVHSGLGNFSKDKKIRDYTREELLWSRPSLTDRYDLADITVIIGHTPTAYYSSKYRNRMIDNGSFWNIDTGAASDSGRPMLLCLDNLKKYYIEEDGGVVSQS